LSTVDGDHVPVIPLSDVVGKDGTPDPAQIVRDVPKLNAGVMFGLITTLKWVTIAHWPGAGVNVYVPEVVLLTIEGLQLPVIPLVDVEGRTGTIPPEQMVREVPKAKTGFAFVITVTFTVAGIPHWLGFGVNV
jgi:hypothetical protein